MLTILDLARPKQTMSPNKLSKLSGPYDHESMRRWNGKDVDLVKLSMKSSTAFDGERSTNEGDPSPM